MFSVVLDSSVVVSHWCLIEAIQIQNIVESAFICLRQSNAGGNPGVPLLLTASNVKIRVGSPEFDGDSPK